MEKLFDFDRSSVIVPKSHSCAHVEDLATLLTQFSAPLPFGKELTCELECVNQTGALRDLHGKSYLSRLQAEAACQPLVSASASDCFAANNEQMVDLRASS